MNDLVNIGLPKWSQMLVTGQSVTIEQAKEIIFRTDRFLTDSSEYSGGNERTFNQRYRHISGLSTIDGNWELQDKLIEKLKVIETTYVHNSWASCSFVGGAHGWCSPEGIINFSDNVGKYPTVSEVLEDWSKIAEAFPYLNLDVTLMDSESCEEDIIPLVNIHIENGYAKLSEPDISVHNNKPKRDIISAFHLRTELGLPQDSNCNWYEDFAKQIKYTIGELTCL